MGRDFQQQKFQQHSSVSPSYGAHFSTVQWTGTRLRSSLEPRTRVHVTRTFGKRSDIFYGASKDPSHEWSYKHQSIVIGKLGPALYTDLHCIQIFLNIIEIGFLVHSEKKIKANFAFISSTIVLCRLVMHDINDIR